MAIENTFSSNFCSAFVMVFFSTKVENNVDPDQLEKPVDLDLQSFQKRIILVQHDIG